MKESGCRRVYLGLESGSQATLDLMNKQVTLEQGARAAELYRQAGIEVAAFFIVGYPGETVAAIEETFALALSLPLDEISFNVPMPLPGSKLFERLGAAGRRQGLDARERGHVRLSRPTSTRLAAAPDRRDDGGVRGAARRVVGSRPQAGAT